MALSVKRALLVILVVLLAGVSVFLLTLPDVRPLRKEFPSTTSFMERRKADLARAGKSTRLEWTPVPLARIAPALQRAVVVAEDARFWEHEGVDWEAVRKVLQEDLKEGGMRRGASTITQQLAKNLYLSSSRTPWRKVREWLIARKLERELSKRRILELYLNVVEFGERTYGAEAASGRYFRKPASQLTPREAATLAATIPSPRVYDPVRHPARVARRANRILRWMGTWRRFPSATPTPAPAATLSEPEAADLSPNPLPASEATPPVEGTTPPATAAEQTPPESPPEPETVPPTPPDQRGGK